MPGRFGGPAGVNGIRTGLGQQIVAPVAHLQQAAAGHHRVARRGFSVRVAPSWGGQAQGGAEALWGRESIAGMAHGGFAQGSRLDGEVGYGLPVGSRFVGTPRVGFSTSEYGRDYRIGYGLGVLNRGKLNLELGVDAQRRESPMLGGTVTESSGAPAWAGSRGAAHRSVAA